ncbi:putative AAA-ATPase [Gregarina niphandrodes]|uniref:AAA-ATPase n=1 Tax=Gregarina niphandrodes TaxID=110365 RepID=A0A023BAL5_GRENI|nr:putative AAA-ATPase [Gregarina niphandrodes]EZG78356.1 putative AAA-ATPase [Gregarina niphandrodes]|eukprot:XP_011129336.1 putative AAA-ATPase [Gregarina niphandrodes]
MYHCGYFTVKDHDKRLNVYSVASPNDDVRFGVVRITLRMHARMSDRTRRSHIRELVTELEAGRLKSFLREFDSFFNCLNMFYQKTDYQFIINGVFCLLGEFIKTELKPFSGGAGAIAETSKRIYKFAFKVDGTAKEALDEAKTFLVQQKEKNSTHKILKVGVEVRTAAPNKPKTIQSHVVTDSDSDNAAVGNAAAA